VVRRLAVAVGAAVAVATSLVGSGALGGTPVAEAAGGALSADATLVAPAGPAFSIWSVIYAGLVAFAVFQALPSRRGDPRQRRVGWLVLASLLLNAGWILCVQAGLVAATVPVIVALLAVLVLAWKAAAADPGDLPGGGRGGRRDRDPAAPAVAVTAALAAAVALVATLTARVRA
jgi:hypothetical protein